MFRPRTLFWILLAAIVVVALWRRFKPQTTPATPAPAARPPRPGAPPPATTSNGAPPASSSGPRRITTRVHRGAPPSKSNRPARTGTALDSETEAAEPASPNAEPAPPAPPAEPAPPAQMPTPAELAASAAEPAEPAGPSETESDMSQPETQPGAATEQLPCNINQASADDLVALPGIGRALANRIIAYRDEHGSFASIEGLLAIQGIGPQNLQEFAHLITVDE